MTNREKLFERLAKMNDEQLAETICSVLCPDGTECRIDNWCINCWEKYLAEDEEGTP